MSTRASDMNDRLAGQSAWRESRFAGLEGESVPSLFRRLAGEVTTLFAQELALAKAETTEAIGEAKAGITGLAAGGAVMFLGLLFLLLAAVYGLSEIMESWLAALIVGGVVSVIGVIMLASGRRKLKSEALRPRHTEASLRKDRNMIRGANPI